MTQPKSSIKEFTFRSDALGEELELLVYLPANYSPLYKYSLVIAQDGKDYFQMGRIGRAADELLAEGRIDNLIIAGIPYRNRFDRREKYLPDGEKNKAYIRFLAHELVPFLENEFPVYHMGMGRTLIGDSLGGTVSLMAALAYPHTFGKVIIQSPLVNDAVLEAAEAFSEPHLLELYHSIGTAETEVPSSTDDSVSDFLAPNRALSSLLKGKGFSYVYNETGGNHTWKAWQAELKQALEEML